MYKRKSSNYITWAPKNIHRVSKLRDRTQEQPTLAEAYKTMLNDEREYPVSFIFN